jgi:hypothetical protein
VMAKTMSMASMKAPATAPRMVERTVMVPWMADCVHICLLGRHR